MFKVYPFSKAKTTLWLGGKTTELYIYPENADYSNRDFGFRISTASIETATSTFTKLSGYNRILAVLEGELEISHEHQFAIKLKPFQSHSFSGDWNTTSKGLARDFNIIFDQSLSINLEVVTINAKTKLSKKTDFLFLFALNNKTKINAQLLGEYDLVEIESEEITLEPGSTFFKISGNSNIII